MAAMFIGQQFLQNVLGYSTLERRRRDPAGGGADGARRPALGEAGRDPRRPVHPARRLRLLPARLPRRCCCCGRRASPTGRSPSATPGRHRRRLRRHAGVALADRLGAGHAGRHGVGHRRPPARPRRRDHAVDPRRPADRRLRRRRQRRDRRLAQQAPDHRQRPERADQVLLQRRRHRRRSTRSYTEQIIAAAKTSFLQGDEWAYSAGIVAVALGATLVFFCFPKRDEEQRLLQRYQDEDAAGAASIQV